MGLLFHHLTKEFQAVADRVYSKHFEDDPLLETEYDQYRKDKMLEDIMHNLSFLQVSYHLNDDHLFHNYSIWLLELMLSLMPDLAQARIKDHMITHYSLLKEALEKELVEKDFQQVNTYLNDAIKTTKNYKPNNPIKNTSQSRYTFHKETYLKYLLEGDSRRAIEYILELKRTGIKLEDIYVDILQSVMHEVGELWHQNKITIDQEHYMTSITQTAMSQFYDVIFKTDRKGLKLLACSVGSELHEMGARMVSDIFEYHGWHTTYLGAAVPLKVFLKSIEKNTPDLVVLSVTMPQHLETCLTFVQAIKALDNPPKIAVGGRAFTMTNTIYKHWPIDIYADDAKALLNWSKEVFVSG